MKQFLSFLFFMSFLFSFANVPFESLLNNAIKNTPIFDENKTRYTLIQDNKGSENWLFVPGGAGANSSYLNYLAKPLTLPGKVWLIDLPGNGNNNPKPSNEKLFNKWFHFLNSAIDKFDKPIYVGHSFGGMIAMSIPELEDKLKSLIVVGSAPCVDIGESVKFMIKKGISFNHDLILAMIKNPIDIIKKKSLVYPIDCHFPKSSVNMGKRFFQTLPFNQKAAVWWFKKAITYKALWAPINIPMLIVGGSEDCICPITLFQRDDRFKRDNISLNVIENAGHFPWLDNPTEVSNVIKKFTQEKLSLRITQNSLQEKLAKTLLSYYKLDTLAIYQILEKLTPLIEDKLHHGILEDFMSSTENLLSEKFQNDDEIILNKNDAVLKAPKTHEVLFENVSFRVLFVKVSLGETVPFHTHQWDSLFLTTKGTTFTYEYDDGTKGEEVCELSLEKLDGSLKQCSYTNTGNTDFEALVFEIKNSSENL